MNAMTIILSATASLLVAALILFWQQDNGAAQKEPVAIRKELAQLKAEIALLKQTNKQHETAVENQANGIPTQSPYGRSVEAQKGYALTTKQIEAREIEIKRKQDQLAMMTPTVIKPDLANQQMTNSALNSASSDTSTPSAPVTTVGDGYQDNISASQQQQRRQLIANAKVYAIVKYIKFEADGDVFYAHLTEGSSLAVDSELVVRRQSNGISGKVRVISIIPNGTKTVLSLTPLPNGIGQVALVLKKGDELILPPTWDQ